MWFHPDQLPTSPCWPSYNPSIMIELGLNPSLGMGRRGVKRKRELCWCCAIIVIINKLLSFNPSSRLTWNDLCKFRTHAELNKTQEFYFKLREISERSCLLQRNALAFSVFHSIVFTPNSSSGGTIRHLSTFKDNPNSREFNMGIFWGHTFDPFYIIWGGEGKDTLLGHGITFQR